MREARNPNNAAGDGPQARGRYAPDEGAFSWTWGLLLALLMVWTGSARAEGVVALQVDAAGETLTSYSSWENLLLGRMSSRRGATNQEGRLVALCAANGKVTALRDVRGSFYLLEFASFDDYVRGQVAARINAGRRHIPGIRGLATDGTRFWAQAFVAGQAHLLRYPNRDALLSGAATSDVELGWPADVAGDIAYAGGAFHVLYDGQLATYPSLEAYPAEESAVLRALPTTLASLVALVAVAGDVDPLAIPSPGLPAEQSGLLERAPFGAYLDGVFPTNTPGIGGWQVVNAFTNVGFVEPMQVLGDPSRPGTLLVVGLDGRIWRIPNRPDATEAEKELVLDIQDRVERIDNDHGLYHVALHPEFAVAGSPNAGFLYGTYLHPRPDLPGYQSGFTKYWRLSRFTVDLRTGRADPASEQVLINQYCPGIWHNGGSLLFGPDGFLYVTVGDNRRAAETAQVLDGGLRSGVLRIDVDRNPARSHPIRRQPTSAEVPVGWPDSYSTNYFIPDDNPWPSPDGRHLEEFYAIGLRNPYTMCLDPVEGQIWIGDVGEVTSEEINRLDRPGLNFQWPFREGYTSTREERPSVVVGTERAPELVYGHSDGGAILCGMVYRGAAHAAELGGQLLIGDNSSGMIWSYDPVARRGKQELANAGYGGGINMGLVDLCPGPDGEVFLPFQGGRGSATGQIRRLVPAARTPQPPARLSETGAFRDLRTLTPHPAFVPYAPASPLWSDGAEKSRWLAIPYAGPTGWDATQVAVARENWLFPAGSVLMKHFEMPLDARHPESRRRLETRFIVCLPDGGKYGVTYRWLEDGSDAVLATGRSTIDYTVTDDSGAPVARQWTVPGRADCLYCHNAAAGQALGLKDHQLNHLFTYPASGRTRNQLATLGFLRMVAPVRGLPELANQLRAHALGDETAPLEHRVRSYLDANCASCHQPGGGGPGFDARLTTALSEQTLVNAALQGHFDFVTGGRIVNAGDPSASAVAHRLTSGVEGVRMPPIGRSLADTNAVDAFDRWIRSLHPEEFSNPEARTVRYFRLRTLSEANGNPWSAIAELRILGADGAAYPQSELRVADVSSENFGQAAMLAIDGDSASMWVSQWAPVEEPQPHTLTLDLGHPRMIGGFEYLPRQDGNPNGRIARWEAEISLDGVLWQPFLQGTFANNQELQRRMAGRGGDSPWPVRPRVGNPGRLANGDFNVVITTDADVWDLELSDLADAVTNGTAVALRGSGHYYVATIHPTGGPVSVRVPGGVMDEGFSSASNTVTVGYQDDPPMLSADVLTAVASQGRARLLLTVDPPLSRPTTVRVFTRPGTALPGVDYQTVDQVLVLPADVSAVDVTIPLVARAGFVPGRGFFLGMEPGPGLTVALDEIPVWITERETGAAVDTDLDGLPDAWEMAHFGDLSQDGEDDPDGDLAGNLLEYLRGTAPDQPGESTVITALQVDAGSVTVTWTSMAGRQYDLYLSGDLQRWTRALSDVDPDEEDRTRVTLPLPVGLSDRHFFVKVVARRSD